MILNTKITRKCCLTSVVVAFFVCGCIPNGKPKAEQKESPQPEWVASLQAIDLADSERVDTIDFGTVKTGEVVSRKIALTNSGEQPKIVISTETVCGCLRLDYTSVPVNRGEKLVAEMWFDSAGYTFFFPRAFYLRGTTDGDVIKKIVVVADME